jgi:hypothetical protein
MRYFRVVLPIAVVIMVVFGTFASYAVDNMPAFYANITALFGWLAISYNEYLSFCLNRSRNVSDTLA